MPEALLAILTREELVAITGYKQKGAQARWLRAHKIRFTLNAMGHPVVGRWHYEQFAGGVGRRRQAEPDWSAPVGRFAVKR